MTRHLTISRSCPAYPAPMRRWGLVPDLREQHQAFGLFYVGFADGGSGRDPYNHGQNLGSAFATILRIRSARTAPTASTALRRRTRLPGQNIVEEISPVTAGANLGWNKWEASFTYLGRQGVGTDNPRGEAGLAYPIAEYDHRDPLLPRAAVTGVYVYRQNAVKALANKLIFGDNPSGEIFYVDADSQPKGGQDAIRRILFNDQGTSKTLLQLIREKNAAAGKPAAPRADLRLGMGPQGQLFVLNKRDGTIRMIVP